MAYNRASQGYDSGYLDDPYRSGGFEVSGVEGEWRADILTGSSMATIKIAYLMEDWNQEIYDQLNSSPKVFRSDYTPWGAVPRVEKDAEHTVVEIDVDIPESLDDEVAEFPSQYLAEIRQEACEQLIEDVLNE